MPEGGRHAPILIATSWQALLRARSGDPETLVTNCTVVLLFAALYVEASLNHVIRYSRKRQRFHEFLNGKKYPGLNDKLMWFYNDYINPPGVTRLTTKGDKRRCAAAVRRSFPGFKELAAIRNELSHGSVNRTARSLQRTETLRKQAKGIVMTVHDTLKARGHHIGRITTYYKALQRF